jgi:Fur family ferric uptake transcriptional regulator
MTARAHPSVRPGTEVVEPASGAARAVPDGELTVALAAVHGAATAPRRAIVEALLAADHLCTPEVLLAAARARAPRTSLATVYRTLERLADAGRLKRATLASGTVGYAYCVSGHHEHAICLGCGRLEPLRPCLIREAPELADFVMRSHTLDFFGLCAACARAEAAGEAGPDSPLDRPPPPA